MQKERNVLLLGSGLMAQSVVTYLLRRPQNRIHIASNLVDDAKKIAEKKGLDRCTYGEVNVQDSKSLSPLVQKSQLVISYVPAFLHIHIAKVCLQLSKNLVTASYVSPEMKALDSEVQKKQLIFLNQLGLDPGIDHLATMKIVDQVSAKGGKILEYQSWCGGLPSPDCCDNPLGYKFTWSPISAFRALKNKAIFIQNNKEVQIQASDLLYFGATIQLNQALSLQGYPNRNSLAYKQIYKLKDATKVLRGTLRYKGFCTIINALKQLNILDEKPVTGTNWLEYITKILQNEPGNKLQDKIRNRCVENVKNYQQLSQKQKNDKFYQILMAFKFFGFLNQNSQIHDQTHTSLENLVKFLEPQLTLRQGEADLIAMQHKFIIEVDNKKIERKSSLILIGEKYGSSAMSKTVGTPTAIGAQLILDGKISQKGVIIPMYPDIYNPVLEQLQKVGIRLFQVDTEL